MMKIDFERKEYLALQVNVFYQNKHKFYTLYKNIKIHNKLRNEVVYIEKTFANSVFLVYNGECSLYKSTNLKNLSKDSKSINDFKCFVKLLTLMRGDFAGLEAIKLFHYYDQSLVVSSELATIMEIQMDQLKDLKAPFIAEMDQLREAKDKIVKNIQRKKDEVQNEMKINFREREINNELKRTKDEAIDQLQSVCIDKYESVVKETIKKKVDKISEGQSKELKVKSESNEQYLEKMSLKNELKSRASLVCLRKSTLNLMIKNDKNENENQGVDKGSKNTEKDPSNGAKENKSRNLSSDLQQFQKSSRNFRSSFSTTINGEKSNHVKVMTYDEKIDNAPVKTTSTLRKKRKSFDILSIIDPPKIPEEGSKNVFLKKAIKSFSKKTLDNYNTGSFALPLVSTLVSTKIA